MKSLRILYLLPALLLVLAGCEKDDALIYYKGGTPPLLSVSNVTPVLDPKKESDVVMVFNWTNPEYQFTTGISSQDVNYMLEIDTVGSNFSNPKKGQVSVAKELSQSFTVFSLNQLLSGLNFMALTPDRTYNFQARIISTLSYGSAKLVSNIVTFTAKPYSPPPVVEMPTAGTLWATGDAFASGWANPLGSPYDVSQKFTKVANANKFTLTVSMPGGGGYKLIQTQGVWGTQYRMLEGGTWQGGSFKKQDSDPQFPGPPTAGTYLLTFDFQTGKFTVVKQ